MIDSEDFLLYDTKAFFHFTVAIKDGFRPVQLQASGTAQKEFYNSKTLNVRTFDTNVNSILSKNIS